jgi:hypothetical protein
MKNVKSIKEATELIHMDRMLALHYMSTGCDCHQLRDLRMALVVCARLSRCLAST